MRLGVAAGVSPVAPTALRSPQPLLIAVFCFLWSSAFSVAKLAFADCPPLLLLTARFLIAGLVMLGVAALGGTQWRRLARRDLIVLVVLGITNNALYLGLNYAGMRSISSGLSALIISGNPVLTAVLSAMFLDEPLTWRKATGLVLGVAGMDFVVEGRIASGSDSLVGILFVIGALVSLVCGTILFKRLAPNVGLWIGNGVQNLAGGLALVPVALTVESLGEVAPSWRLMLALAYCALLVAVVAYLIWFRLLATSGATAASAYHFIMPPLGLLFGWLLLGESVAVADLLGIVPVALGIFLVTRPRATPA